MGIKTSDTEERFYFSITATGTDGKQFKEESEVDIPAMCARFLENGSSKEVLPVLIELQKISAIQKACYYMNINLMVPKLDLQQ